MSDDDQTDNLPAEQKDAMLAIRTDQLPDAQRYASDSVTDVLPPAAYQGIGSLANTLSAEQEAILDEPLPDDEVDIRPDGLVFASHEFYRRTLNKVFGRLSWTLIPGSPLKPRSDKSDARRTEFYQRWILFINGIYVAEAIASRTLWESNSQMTLDDVAEAIKSDALKRCAKDLGIAHECWQKRWTERWRKQYAIQVVVETRDGRQNQWRRKDADPLPREVSTQSRKQQPAPPESPPPAGDAVKETPKAAEQPSAGNSPSPPTPAPAAGGVRRGPTLNPAQVNLVFARARAAGLVVGDDASKLIKLLVGAGIPGGDVKLITMSELKVILPAIDAAKSTDTERI